MFERLKMKYDARSRSMGVVRRVSLNSSSIAAVSGDGEGLLGKSCGAELRVVDERREVGAGWSEWACGYVEEWGWRCFC